MYCKACGKELDADSKFCDKCGLSINAEENPILNNPLETNLTEQVSINSTTKTSILKNKKAIFAFCAICFIIIAVICFSGDSIPEKQILSNAQYQVSEQIFSKDGPVFKDVKIVDTDSHNRFIVTMTQDKMFEDYWAVWLEYDKNFDHYYSYCAYHGMSSEKYGAMNSQSDWIEIYKTNPDFRWGEETMVVDNNDK